jgi:hypothetical protein
MKLLRVCASLAALVCSTSLPLWAQGAEGTVRTVGAVHMVTLPAGEGSVIVYVSADAAVGDVLSGLIVPIPRRPVGTAGAWTDGLVVESEALRAPVSDGRYHWVFPPALRAGAALTLRDGLGRAIARATVPVDPVPAASRVAAAAGAAYVLPTEAQGGVTTAIRGRFDGALPGKVVTLGATPAEVLAISPRQLAFLVPRTRGQVVPLGLTVDGRAVAGPAPFRVFGIELEVPLLRPTQRGTLKVTVSGLAGITDPVRLTLRNESPALYRVENIEKAIPIEPGRVRRDGTAVVERRITGIIHGMGRIEATVGSRPLAQFEPQRSTTITLEDWQARTGVGITADAGAHIHQSLAAARAKLDDVLGVQQSFHGDVQAVFAALLAHYCFDLRDEALARRRAEGAWPDGPGPRLVLASFRVGQAAGVEISAQEVKRRSFSDFLSDLVGRFTREQQALGYLFVSSMPVAAGITLNNERRTNGFTNRRIVAPVGEHVVAVAAPRPCREVVTVTAFQTKVFECGP